MVPEDIRCSLYRLDMTVDARPSRFRKGVATRDLNIDLVGIDIDERAATAAQDRLGQALEAGVHPKVVSERLGHANINITLEIYSHVTPAMQTDAAERIAAMFFRTS